MTIENIDNVLEQLVLSGGSKIDWGGEGSEGRAVPVGAWSIVEDTDCSHLKHLHETITKRLCLLDLTVTDDACLRAMFDPETRRIEAFDVYEVDTGGILLTLMFWPGLESAKKLAASTFDQWHKAVDEGWFDGI